MTLYSLNRLKDYVDQLRFMIDTLIKAVVGINNNIGDIADQLHLDVDNRVRIIMEEDIDDIDE